MSDVKKKKGILAAILNSMKKTGGCCGPGESCCGPAKPKSAKNGAIPKPDGCGSSQENQGR
ncbi:MAG: hypothetical protein HN742_25400 [Lentisphaerae bacterium]|jgi:hypothetical protein|nr:hypothetical protein [Lentisphaerota bacterium]MBT4817708.1 hypothetical protein [Lentisphaerota bacterium]MBT5612257.1 hypothetical protein [Lentisphaerota bacterium]MBT7060765.1 hypothetical protein [Lentisphaerota bacterium]MBT7845236.1 hypothetical protein [Lentisphaerota bacterium]